MGIGEAGALGSSILWAISSIIFGQTRLTAWQINLAKNVVGGTLVLVAILVMAAFQETIPFRIPLADLGFLVASGWIGLTIGDTFFFRSLQILGPRRALVLTTTTPIFSAFLGLVVSGEPIFELTLPGTIIAAVGVSMVVRERRAKVEAPGLYPGDAVRGVGAGLAAAFCQALGAALSKNGMDECTAFEATFVRLTAAVVAAVVVSAVMRKLRDTVVAIVKKSNLKRVLPAAFIGTFLGVSCHQLGIQNSPVVVAATLGSLSPLIATPIVRVLYGHPISYRAILGKLIAIIGATLVVAETVRKLIEPFTG